MGFLDRILGRETRASALPGVAASDPFLAEKIFGAGPGAPVAPAAALSASAVAVRCVAIRSELTSSVPLFVFRRTADGGRERADDHPLYAVLHDQANDQESALEARERLVRSLDLTGNAYAEIVRDGRGQVLALQPHNPGDVFVERLPNGRLRYRVSEWAGGVRVLLQEEVLHIRGPSADGMLGVSALRMGAAAVSLRVRQAETAQALMANSLRPSGVLAYPQTLTRDQNTQIRDGVRERLQGATKAGELLILDGGVKFERMTFTPEDAEFLASTKLSNEDICRLFAVPPTVAGMTDNGTYSNTEQEGRALVQNCLGPLASRIEAAMARCLLTPEERRTLYVEHDLSGLLRGDVTARFEAYKVGREIGVYSPNDVRKRENEPPIPNGDSYAQPVNWAPLGSTPVVQPSAQPAAESA